MLRIEVLGPLQVTTESGPIRIGGQTAVLLGWLAMHANRPLRIEEIARLSADDAPAGSEQRARTLLRRLAADLAGAIDLAPATACLTADEGTIDAAQFTALAADARRHWREGDHERVAEDVERALALWRSDPYPELAHLLDAMPAIEALNRTRLAVLETQQEVAMDRGVDFTTVAQLRQLASAHPERLGFRLLLARALHLL
ncbi:MAG TPA: hypothetical protein H9815_06195, partial [Candidatus Ruania gallistercoris]|nr:hypothetical protein [Candidatus Ruania gallistercoris]